MCLETACCEMSNGAASSLTVAGPRMRRWTMARRVRSERAAKVRSKYRSTTIWLYIIEEESRGLREFAIQCLCGRREGNKGFDINRYIWVFAYARYGMSSTPVATKVKTEIAKYEFVHPMFPRSAPPVVRD